MTIINRRKTDFVNCFTSFNRRTTDGTDGRGFVFSGEVVPNDASQSTFDCVVIVEIVVAAEKDVVEVSSVVKRVPDSGMESLEVSTHAARVAVLGLDDGVAVQAQRPRLVLTINFL